MDKKESLWRIGLQKLLTKCNSFYLPGSSRLQSKPFVVDGAVVGWIPPYILQHLLDYTDVFCCLKDTAGNITEVAFAEKLRSYDERSNRMDDVMKSLRDCQKFHVLQGWRNEMYKVSHTFTSPPLFKMERSATCIRQYGVHVHGFYYDKSNGELVMWIGKRSKSKPTFPGKLDNMAAGGIAVGLSVNETLIKECAEEASIPEELAMRAVPTGSITYFYEDDRGLFPETQFIYDLELPSDFTPKILDGEVDTFYPMKLEEIKQRIANDEFKPNSALTIVDFMIKKGYLKPDEDDYLRIVSMLHRNLEY